MKFIPLALAGAYVIELEKLEDERGYFARSWCRREFLDHGLDARIEQCSLSFNRWKGTLRGMHYQVPPAAEAKLVRCDRGSLFDVIIDLRPESPSFLKWCGVELTPDNGRMMYVPKGFAHGFQTLSDATEVFYQISEPHSQQSARNVRWNDPLFSIHWPLPATVISERDQRAPDAVPAQFSELARLWKSE